MSIIENNYSDNSKLKKIQEGTGEKRMSQGERVTEKGGVEWGITRAAH